MSRPANSHKRPLVSVLTPSFNQVKWIGDNLRSVSIQTYDRIEHIVMDGGSSDGTQELLRQQSGPAVNWRSEPDRGQSNALNKAFAASRGEILGWLNSDDAYFGPTVVDDAVKVFEADPSIDVVYGHAALVDARGRILQILWVPPFSHQLLRLHDFIIQPAAFVRRRCLEGHFVDESFDYTMDYELWLRLAVRHRLRRIDRIMAIDRHHSARKSYAKLDVGAADHAKLAQSYRIWRGGTASLARKTWKILARLAGARLVGMATTSAVAFRALRDDRHQLLLRQIAIPRAAMGTGENQL